MDDFFLGALYYFNEAITATTVIIAASLLFYNLSHGLRDRVVRASSVVLGCVIAVYVGDVFIALGSNNPNAHIEAWLRLQWIGIAFMPAGLFHLSDALLATTGIISRGRRRRVMRILYIYGIVFLLTAAGSNLIIRDVVLKPFATMQAGPAVRAVSDLLWADGCGVVQQRAARPNALPDSRHASPHELFAAHLFNARRRDFSVCAARDAHAQ